MHRFMCAMLAAVVIFGAGLVFPEVDSAQASEDLDRARDSQRAASVSRLAEEFDVTEERIRSLEARGMSIEEIRNTLFFARQRSSDSIDAGIAKVLEMREAGNPTVSQDPERMPAAVHEIKAQIRMSANPLLQIRDHKIRHRLDVGSNTSFMHTQQISAPSERPLSGLQFSIEGGNPYDDFSKSFTIERYEEVGFFGAEPKHA